MLVPESKITAQQVAEKRRVLAGMAAALGHLEDDLARRAEQLARLTGNLDALELRRQQLQAAEGEQAELLSTAIDAAWSGLEGDLARASSEIDDGPDPDRVA